MNSYFTLKHATLSVLTASVILVGSAQATVYVWLGNNNDADNAANWSYDGGLDGGDPATPITGGNQPRTNSSNDIIRFVGTYTSPQNLYTRNNNNYGQIQVYDGTVNYQNDGNNQGQHSVWDDGEIGGPTTIIGNGDSTSAILNYNIREWNEDGTGTKTYLVNSDGTLASNRGGNHRFSSSAGQDTVFQIIGGAVNINGQFFENDILADAGDYVSFEAIGSSFTFTKGTAADRFDVASDITNAFGDSFRLGGAVTNKILALTDNGATWTITAVPEPSSMALLGLGGIFLMRRRRSVS